MESLRGLRWLGRLRETFVISLIARLIRRVVPRRIYSDLLSSPARQLLAPRVFEGAMPVVGRAIHCIFSDAADIEPDEAER